MLIRSLERNRYYIKRRRKDMNLVSNYVFNSIPRYIFNATYYNILHFKTNPLYLNKVLSFFYLDHNTQAKLFIDLIGIDFLEKQNRFVLVYHVYSHIYNMRYYIKINANELIWVPSITNLYPASRWYEREIWDLFGVHFSNNLDLRRILTDYGFKGHPFRKDFPIGGYVQLSFNERLKTLVYSKVRFVQEFRNFDTLMPWKFYYSIYPDYDKLKKHLITEKKILKSFSDKYDIQLEPRAFYQEPYSYYEED